MKELSKNTFRCFHNQTHKIIDVTSTQQDVRAMRRTQKEWGKEELWAPSQLQRILRSRFPTTNDLTTPMTLSSWQCSRQGDFLHPLAPLNHAPHSSISPFPSTYPSRRDNPPTQTETYHILFVVWIWHPTTSMYYPQSHYHASLTIHTKVNPSDWYWGRSPTYAPLSQFIPCSSTNLPPHLRAYGAHGQYMHFTQLPAHHGVDPTTYIISQDIKFISSLKASSNSPTTMDHVNFHPMLNF